MKTTLDKNTLIKIGKEIEQALASIEAKYGIKIKAGNGTYNELGTHASMKVEMATIVDGLPVTRDVSDLISYRSLLGLSDTQLKHPVKFGKESFFVYGYKPRTHKLTIGLPNKEFATHEMKVDAFKAYMEKEGVA
jgi:hypothetical protein